MAATHAREAIEAFWGNSGKRNIRGNRGTTGNRGNSIEAIEAIHSDYDFAKNDYKNLRPNQTTENQLLIPQYISAFMIGLKSKITTFKFQRAINNYSKEPLLAILPGVVLSELWQIMGLVENTLF